MAGRVERGSGWGRGWLKPGLVLWLTGVATALQAHARKAGGCGEGGGRRNKGRPRVGQLRSRRALLSTGQERQPAIQSRWQAHFRPCSLRTGAMEPASAARRWWQLGLRLCCDCPCRRCARRKGGCSGAARARSQAAGAGLGNATVGPLHVPRSSHVIRTCTVVRGGRSAAVGGRGGGGAAHRGSGTSRAAPAALGRMHACVHDACTGRQLLRSSPPVLLLLLLLCMAAAALVVSPSRDAHQVALPAQAHAAARLAEAAARAQAHLQRGVVLRLRGEGGPIGLCMNEQKEADGREGLRAGLAVQQAMLGISRESEGHLPARERRRRQELSRELPLPIDTMRCPL